MDSYTIAQGVSGSFHCVLICHVHHSPAQKQISAIAALQDGKPLLAYDFSCIFSGQPSQQHCTGTRIQRACHGRFPGQFQQLCLLSDSFGAATQTLTYASWFHLLDCWKCCGCVAFHHQEGHVHAPVVPEPRRKTFSSTLNSCLVSVRHCEWLPASVKGLFTLCSTKSMLPQVACLEISPP